MALRLQNNRSRLLAGRPHSLFEIVSFMTQQPSDTRQRSMSPSRTTPPTSMDSFAAGLLRNREYTRRSAGLFFNTCLDAGQDTVLRCKNTPGVRAMTSPLFDYFPERPVTLCIRVPLAEVLHYDCPGSLVLNDALLLRGSLRAKSTSAAAST
ncbi:hypothetical protein BDN71DRAFT_1511589 [Pleurotus eryngii]|uniref:Uncharacterized protein n=1 Tax=Pleurotus eryngii TaxID=5323 RepID=A0A9P5ZN52_PLEER|nr:hypothetical protein BDN71DRAFT_1511589 [Pleurotus eryngii]